MAERSAAVRERAECVQRGPGRIRAGRGVRPEILKSRLVDDTGAKHRGLGCLECLGSKVVMEATRYQVEPTHARVLDGIPRIRVAESQSVVCAELVIHAGRDPRPA